MNAAYTIKICHEEHFEFQHEIQLLQDLGYLGHRPINAIVQMPMKNSKYRKLKEEDKNENKNKMKSSRRVAELKKKNINAAVHYPVALSFLEAYKDSRAFKKDFP